MSRGLLLDTHVWVWIGNRNLYPDRALVERINQAGDRDALFLSSISLFEVANACSRGRLQLAARTIQEWFSMNLRQPGPRILELTPEIAVQTTKLPDTFHGDPGDRLLAATAQIEDLTIVTHDKALLRFGQQGLFSTMKAHPKRMQP